eukprot:g3593.t1
MEPVFEDDDPVEVAASFYSVGGRGDQSQLGFIPFTTSTVASDKGKSFDTGVTEEEEPARIPKEKLFASEVDKLTGAEVTASVLAGEAAYGGVTKVEVDEMIFNAAFCSGNLQRVCGCTPKFEEREKVEENHGNENESYLEETKTSASDKRSPPSTSSKKAVVDPAGVMRPPRPHEGRVFRLWITEDCKGMECETASKVWFYFSATNLKEENVNNSNRVRLIVSNMNRVSKMFRYGMRPVYRICTISKETYFERIGEGPAPLEGVDEGDLWRPIPLGPHVCKGPEGLELWIDHDFPEVSNDSFSVVYLAFCFPYSFATIQRNLKKAEKFVLDNNRIHPRIYYHRELLVYSLQGRRVDLITITSDDSRKGNLREPGIDGLFSSCTNPVQSNDSNTNSTFTSNERPFQFKGKKIVFISARVHPGETPASYIFDGVLKFLLDINDERAVALRDNFVFKLIPCLNPDGVSLGHHRNDSMGRDLNRFYMDCERNEHPVIYAVMKVLEQIKELSSLYMYVDLHAHASKTGMFMFGNHMPALTQRIETRLFPWLLGHNCSLFEFDSCDFSLSKMNNRDRTGYSKAGCGRVAVFKATGCLRVYTLESHYYSGKRNQQHGLQYGPRDWNELGKKSMVSLHDMLGKDNSQLSAGLLKAVQEALGMFCIETKTLNDQNPCITIPPRVPNPDIEKNVISARAPNIPTPAQVLKVGRNQLREKLTGIRVKKTTVGKKKLRRRNLRTRMKKGREAQARRSEEGK